MKIRGRKGMEQLKKDYVTSQERLRLNRKEKRKKRLIDWFLRRVITNLKCFRGKIMNRIIGFKALKNYIFLSRATVWRLVHKKGFPKPISFDHSKSKYLGDK